eukprot:7446889-Pyramimonas_sp.AAC.1
MKTLSSHLLTLGRIQFCHQEGTPVGVAYRAGGPEWRRLGGPASRGLPTKFLLSAQLERDTNITPQSGSPQLERDTNITPRSGSPQLERDTNITP